MPCSQEFGSSEQCTTTNRILYNLESEKKTQAKEVEGKGAKTELAYCQNSLPGALQKCNGRWHLVFTCMSTNSQRKCWLSAFWPLCAESRKDCHMADRKKPPKLGSPTKSQEHCVILKENGVPVWPWRWISKITLLFPQTNHHRTGQVRSLRFKCQDLTAFVSVYIFLKSTLLTALSVIKKCIGLSKRKIFFFKLQDCDILYWPWDKYSLLTSRTGKVNEVKLGVTLVNKNFVCLPSKSIFFWPRTAAGSLGFQLSLVHVVKLQRRALSIKL